MPDLLAALDNLSHRLDPNFQMLVGPVRGDVFIRGSRFYALGSGRYIGYQQQRST